MKTKTLRRSFVAACIVAATTPCFAQYTLTDLGQGTVYAVNDLGVVVGDTTNSQGYTQATEWSNGVANYLNYNSNLNVQAVSINDSGAIVGNAYDPGSEQSTAILWNGAVPTALPSLHSSAIAGGINNAGQIAGTIILTSSSQAVVWSGSGVTFLAPEANHSNANSINNAGMIAGIVGSPISDVGVTWGSVGANATYASIGSRWSSLTQISTGGVGIGQSLAGDYVWSNGKATLFDGNLFSVNDNGLIAGLDSDGAILYDGTTITKLDSYLTPDLIKAGWILNSATSVSDTGFVVGQMSNTITGQIDAYELSPIAAVPEPSSYAMLLVGLGLLGFTKRRTK